MQIRLSRFILIMIGLSALVGLGAREFVRQFRVSNVYDGERRACEAFHESVAEVFANRTGFKGGVGAEFGEPIDHFLVFFVRDNNLSEPIIEMKILFTIAEPNNPRILEQKTTIDGQMFVNRFKQKAREKGVPFTEPE